MLFFLFVSYKLNFHLEAFPLTALTNEEAEWLVNSKGINSRSSLLVGMSDDQYVIVKPNLWNTGTIIMKW